MSKLKAVLPTRFLTLLLFAALVQVSQSVTVTLQDGSQVKGGFAGGGADEIKVLVAGQTLTLKTATIENIKFDSAAADSHAQGFVPTTPQSAPVMPFPAGATIPAGTAVFVRLIDSADSTHDEVGKVYRASLDDPVLSPTGHVIVPRGADASLVLTKQEQSGHLTGKTKLTLTLRSLTIQGKQYDVASSDVAEASSSRTARSGKTIGGLAAAGAVIGAPALLSARSAKCSHPASVSTFPPRRDSRSVCNNRCWCSDASRSKGWVGAFFCPPGDEMKREIRIWRKRLLLDEPYGYDILCPMSPSTLKIEHHDPGGLSRWEDWVECAVNLLIVMTFIWLAAWLDPVFGLLVTIAGVLARPC